MNVKTNLMEEHEVRAVQLQAQHATEMEKAQSTIRALKDRLSRSLSVITKAGRMLDNYSVYAVKQSHQQKYFWESAFSVRGCFAAWCEQIKWKRQKKSRNYRTRRHNEHRLKRLGMNRWRRQVCVSLTAKREERFEEKMDSVCGQIVEKYDADIATLRAELAEARKQTDFAQNQCLRMEEDMRRVFLKGVSAMNLEALSLFKEKTLAFSRADSCLSNTDEALPVASASAFAFETESEKPRAAAPIPIPRSKHHK